MAGLSKAFAGGFIFADHLVGIRSVRGTSFASRNAWWASPTFGAGKTTLGIDCSGLVQISSCQAARALFRRDTDMQNGAGRAHRSL